MAAAGQESWGRAHQLHLIPDRIGGEAHLAQQIAPFISPNTPPSTMFAASQAIQTIFSTINSSPETQFLLLSSAGILGLALAMEALWRRRENRKREIFFAPP